MKRLLLEMKIIKRILLSYIEHYAMHIYCYTYDTFKFTVAFHKLYQYVYLAVHDKNKPNKCTICDYKSTTKAELKSHIRSVHEKIKVQCQLCEASFSRPSRLKLHVASVHEGKKPYQCSNCDFRSAVEAGLKRHVEQVHEKKDRKLCILCNNTFSTNYNLNAHIASVHEGKNLKKTKKITL